MSDTPQYKRKTGTRGPSRRASGEAAPRKASSPPSPRQASPRTGIKPKETQPPEPPSRNPFGRLVDRANRIDWRYKLQLTVGFCLAIVIPTYVFRQYIFDLGEWGYLGAFVINGISSATIVLPAPGGAVIAIMAQDFNPILIGMAAGIGGTIGGATAYMAGSFNSRGAQQSRWFRWLQSLMGRFGGAIVFTFALIPILPGDLASLVAGTVRYSIPKYLLYNGAASMIKMTAIAYGGADLLSYLERTFREWAGGLF